MAIIMRSNGQKRDQGDKRKQLYTWVGCGMVIVLTLISVVSNMGSESKAPDYSKFSSSRMQDLAALPFGSDAEASNFLRGNPEYSEVSNADLLGSLFSSEDRKERHEKDISEGIPPAPDPEYREILKQKERDEEAKIIEEARIQRRSRDKEIYNQEKERVLKKEKEKVSRITKNQDQKVRSQNNTTKPGTLESNRFSNSGGSASTGVTGSIWRYEGKDIKGGGVSSDIANHVANSQDIAFAKKYGRNVGLDVAAIESIKGANAESAEGAAAGAIDAFQGGVDAEGLEKDEQELGLDEELPTIDPSLQDDIGRSINDEIKNEQNSKNNSSGTAKGKEYSINENCMDTNGHFVRSCFWSNFWSNLGKAGIDCVTSGCWTNWFKDSNSVSGDYAFHDGKLFYKGECRSGC